jgi:hypothetical protein
MVYARPYYVQASCFGEPTSLQFRRRIIVVALMNTLMIYEQFRAVLGEEGAKGFAQTLGTMFEEAKNAATKEDLRSLRQSNEASTARLESAITNLAQAQARTEAQVKELAQAQARTETRVEEPAEYITSFSTILNQLVIRYDRHEGSLLELRFRDRLPAYLGRFLRKGRVIQASDLLDQIEPKLAEAAVDDFLRTDVVATGMVEGQPTYLVGEVSYTVDADDVMRAARRAACLVKAGLPTIPLVACEKISPQTTAYARQEGVRVWVDGSLLDV